MKIKSLFISFLIFFSPFISFCQVNDSIYAFEVNKYLYKNNSKGKFHITLDSSNGNICVAHLSDSMNIFSVLSWQLDSSNNCNPIGQFYSSLISDEYSVDSISQFDYGSDTTLNIEYSYCLYFCTNILLNISEKYLVYEVNTNNFSFSMLGKCHADKFDEMMDIVSEFVIKYNEELISN